MTGRGRAGVRIQGLGERVPDRGLHLSQGGVCGVRRPSREAARGCSQGVDPLGLRSRSSARGDCGGWYAGTRAHHLPQLPGAPSVAEDSSTSVAISNRPPKQLFESHGSLKRHISKARSRKGYGVATRSRNSSPRCTHTEGWGEGTRTDPCTVPCGMFAAAEREGAAPRCPDGWTCTCGGEDSATEGHPGTFCSQGQP